MKIIQSRRSLAIPAPKPSIGGVQGSGAPLAAGQGGAAPQVESTENTMDTLGDLAGEWRVEPPSWNPRRTPWAPMEVFVTFE